MEGCRLILHVADLIGGLALIKQEFETLVSLLAGSEVDQPEAPWLLEISFHGFGDVINTLKEVFMIVSNELIEAGHPVIIFLGEISPGFYK